MYVRASDRQYQARESGTAANVADNPRSKQRCNQYAVDDVPGPEPWRLERSDQAKFLATSPEVRSKLAGAVNVRAKERGRDIRLRLDLCADSNSNVSRETNDGAGRECFT